MPVTARLLQRLKETLGDEATDDLFAWFNEAGWVNRAAVREVADLYFARFDTRLEAGLAGLREGFDTRLETGLAGLRERLETGLAGLREGFDTRLETGLARLQERFETRLEAGLAGLRTEVFARLDSELAKLRAEFTARLETGLADQRSELLKWMFIFWAGTIIPLAGLILAVLGAVR